MKKFIIFTHTLLFYSLTPFYGFSSDLLKPSCSKLFNNKRESFDKRIQTLMDYSGEPREPHWLQTIIQLMEKQVRVKYPDSIEMQAILKFLEEKIGDKNQLLKVLRLSPRILHGLRENSLETHLKPLFETLENIFGQDIVLSHLKQSLGIIELKSYRVKQITNLLKGDTPILIFEDQKTFTIQLGFTDREIKNLFIKYPDAYKISLKNFIGSYSLRTEKYQKGAIQILWPFIKSFIKENLNFKEKNLLSSESEINRQTTEAIKTLFFQSPLIFKSKPETLVELFEVLTGKQKLLINFNKEIIELNFGFENYEIGQLILENRNGFLRNSKKKLRSNIEILWPFIETLAKEHLEPTRGKTLIQSDIRDETILNMKKLFIQAPLGFIIKPTSLDNLIKILTGEKEISFLHNNETIKLRIKLKDSNIGHLFKKNSSGFLLQLRERLEFTIKTLWPFIKSFVQENLKSQKHLEINQENLVSETVRAIEEAIFQSLQGFSPKIESLNNLIKTLKGEKEISFPYNNQTLKLRLSFENHQIGHLFLKDPTGFSRMSQKKLELIIETLWPFIKAFTQENLKLQKHLEINQENLESEVAKNIEKAMFHSIQGFSIKSESFNNLIKILKGEKEISFSFEKQIIKLRFNFKNHEIGELFLSNPFGFSHIGKRLEQVLEALWPSLKEHFIFQEGTTISKPKEETNFNQNKPMKELIRKVFNKSTSNLN